MSDFDMYILPLLSNQNENYYCWSSMIMSSYFNVFAPKNYKDLCWYRPKPHFVSVSKLLEGSVYAKKEGVTFILAVVLLSWRRCVFPNMVTFLSHAWGIRPITTHWIAGQSEHSALFRKAGQRGATIMYSMWKIMFLNLSKHIALHQIHQIMLCSASSYNPFKLDLTVCRNHIIYMNRCDSQ